MMQNIPIARFYHAHGSDLETLKNFFTTARALTGHHTGYLHAGDVMWRLTLKDDVGPENNICFWEDASFGTVGVACFFGVKDFEFHLHQSLPDDRFHHLAVQMLEWAEARYLELAARDDEAEGIITQAPATNISMQAALEQAGFERDDYENFIYLRDLTQPIPNIGLPQGYTVRHVIEGDFEERIRVHQDAWDSPYFTIKRYHRVRSISGFIPELDLVVVSSEGVFTAYCIAWRSGGVGEFEPVGTRVRYRKQGFGRAVILEGCRRLRDEGAHTATVYSYPENRGFYEACGFQVVNQWLGYVKKP